MGRASARPTEFLHINDLVVVLMHEYRRGKGSGIEVETDTAVVFTVRQGRVIRIQGYMDQATAVGVGDVAGERGDREGGL